jgi:hypothetical protein
MLAHDSEMVREHVQWALETVKVLFIKDVI